MGGGEFNLGLPKEIGRNMQIVKNSAIYLFSSIINKMIPFLLLPIITKYLTPTEYGLYGMYPVFIFFYSICSMGYIQYY